MADEEDGRFHLSSSATNFLWDITTPGENNNRFENYTSSSSSQASTTTSSNLKTISTSYGNWPSNQSSRFSSSTHDHHHHHHGGVVLTNLSSHMKGLTLVSNDSTNQSMDWNGQYYSLFRSQTSYQNHASMDASAAYGSLLLSENPQQASYGDSSYNRFVDEYNPFRASTEKKQFQLIPKQNMNIPLLPSLDEKPKVIITTEKKTNAVEASNKRPLDEETTSSLPALKVRKVKMGDRISALQQLVSPFGKTDTSSVLSEAIQYIKILHEQVCVLISSPNFKNGNPTQHQQYTNVSNDDQEGTLSHRRDLRSRGLCLVPISSTFALTHETTADFWTPTFAATFR